MSTLPASYDVNILPGVINAGGAALNLVGLMLTQTQRIPYNSGGVPVVQSFQNASAVSAIFGPTSNEYNKALAYFPGFTNATAQPAALLIASYPQTDVAAWMRSGALSGTSLVALQGITAGALTLTVDGYIHTTSTLNLAGASSYSAAATLIQNAINTSEPVIGTATTYALTAGTGWSATGSISDDVLTITSTPSNPIIVGSVITGSGVTAGTTIVAQLTSTVTGGALNGAGTYAVNIAQAIASETISGTFGIFAVTAVGSGTFSVGQTLSGGTIAAGTQIMSLGTGTGLTGTYYTNLNTASSTGTATASATAITVTYDSITNAFVVTSGITGSPSTMLATGATGSAAAQLFMSPATGAIISQGATAETPAAYMASVTNVTQNWATFFTAFDPDNGLGNAQKLLFAQWTNSTNNRYGYVCWDSDVTPTLSNTATSSLGYIIAQQTLNGTFLLNSPTDLNHQAMISGWAASINFNTINGRITFKFKTQSGIIASVTNAQVASNLTANGYNFIGAVATASQPYVYLEEGGVSGVFQWFDSYINQIWMNAALQQAILNFLVNVNSVPYNAVGYSMIEAACLTPINQAVYFGAIQPGLPLSSSQIQQINNQAGINVATTLAARGWYLLIQPATPQVRQARQSPPCIFWYMDGESIHKIVLSSLDVQ